MQKSLFSSGTKSSKATLFNKAIFVNEDNSPMDANQMKNLRSKIRKYINAVSTTFIAQGNTLNAEQLKDFVDTYQAYYAKADYTVASIYDGGDNAKKASFKALLDFAKPNGTPKKGTKK